MMRIALFVLGVLVCGLSGPLAQAANRVMVVDSLQTTEKLRKEAKSAIDEALIEQGFDPVTSVRVSGKVCDTPACYASMARDADAQFTLAVQGTATPSGYRVSLELRDGTSGKTLGSDSKECELCDARDLRKAMRERTSALVVRVQREQSTLSPQPVPPPESFAPKVETPSASQPASPPVNPRRSLFQQPIPLVGMGMTLFGAILTGVGTYYVAVDGKCDNPNCVLKRDTGTFGWISLGSGIAAILAGSALVVWGRDTVPLSLAVGPDQLSLYGRF